MRRERGDEKALFAVVCDAKYLASERRNTDAGKRKKRRQKTGVHPWFADTFKRLGYGYSRRDIIPQFL